MFGRKKPPIIPKRSGGTPSQHAWHAIDIAPGHPACPEVKAYGTRRFLAGEAPRLPLEDCSTPWRCHCVYRHFPDRRVSPRRASERGFPPLPWFGKNRRQKGGRRFDDGP
jgi:hypothetical protein